MILNFIGAATLASIPVRSKGQILKVLRQRVPGVRTTDRHEKGLETAYDEAILRMPEVQARLWQSKVAFIGLALLTVGFLLQLIGVISS